MFKLETYGLSIYVSEDCLPPDLKECNLFVKANLATNVAMPSGSILASAVYHITTVPAIERFNQHVEISMVHCANDFSQLKFVIAKEQVPYKFEYMDGGKFEVDAKTGTKFGRMHISSFSNWAIVAFKYIQHTFYTLLGYISAPPDTSHNSPPSNNPVVPDPPDNPDNPAVPDNSAIPDNPAVPDTPLSPADIIYCGRVYYNDSKYPRNRKVTFVITKNLPLAKQVNTVMHLFLCYHNLL